MLEYFVIIGLIIGTGCWIVYPLFKPRQLDGSSTTKIDEKLMQLKLRKEVDYNTIKELEFDLKMGKLSKEDYETLKEEHMLDAVDCLKEIDELQSNKKGETVLAEADIEKEIEEEISAIRRRRPPKKRK